MTSSTKGRPLLRRGSRVAVVAPSGVFDPAGLDRGMAEIRSWGLEPVQAPHLYARHRTTAGTAAQRAADLAWALSSPDIAAVWAARGGHGAVHLLPDLAGAVVDDRPLIGFSDVTALFCALWRAGVGRGVHGPVLHSLADHCDADSRAWLRSMLLDGRGGLLPGQHLAGPPARLEAPLVGGNLCVLASLCGTPWALRAEGCIVLLEDIAEPAYKIDRMVHQLRGAGCLDGAVGIALGSFTACSVPDGADWTLADLLVELLEPLGVPVVAGLPVGHGPANRSFVVGAPAILDTGQGLHVRPG